MAMNFPANPTDGETIDGPGNVTWTWDGTKWTFMGGPGTSAMIAFSFPGQPAAAAISNIITAIALTAPASFAGSMFYAGTGAAAAGAFTINHISGGNTTAIGSINIQTGAFSGAGGVIAVGDVLQVVAPATQDAALADVSISLLMTRS